MSLTSAIGPLRDFFDTARVDQIQINRTAVKGTLNPTTLQYDGGSATQIYSGTAVIRPDSEVPTLTEKGQEATTLAEYAIGIPHDIDCQPDDRVTVTLAAYDPSLTGLEFIVRSTTNDSFGVLTWLHCELDQGSGSEPA